MYKKEKNHEALDTVILTEVRENPKSLDQRGS